MPGLQDLLANLAQPPPGGGQQQPQPNSLAQIAPQKIASQPQPAPTRAQTVAAVHQFGQIKAAMRPLLDDPNLGKANIRPKLLDTMSKLLANKTLTLPEIMKAVKALPENPMEQFNFVKKIYDDNDKAQMLVLGHHAMAPQQQPSAGGPPADEWSQDTHADHMSSLVNQYGGARG